MQTEHQSLYVKHKVEIGQYTYICKYDRKTNKPMYKRKYSVSMGGDKPPLRRMTKQWRTSVTKVNQDVEKERAECRENGIELKQDKHLYVDIVEEYYKLEVENCINHNRSFEVVEKFYSHNYNYVLNKKYSNFINKYVEDLTVFDIKQLKKDIITRTTKMGLSVLTVGHIFTSIDKALRYCGEKMYIDDSIVENVRIAPKGKRRNKVGINKFLLKDEYDYLMNVFDKDFKFSKSETDKQNEYRKKLYYTYLSCAFLLGFRRGEGFAMKWKDYQGEVTCIQATLNTKNVKKHIKYKTSRLIDPKTEHSIREVRTPKSIQHCLNEWKEYCQSLGMDTSDDDLIFVELNGSNLNPTTFRNRFRKIVDESGVEQKFNKQLHVHSFRHSCCSFLIQKLREKDADMGMRDIAIVVGQYLGHGSGKMVEQVYGHLYPQQQDCAINSILDEI